MSVVKNVYRWATETVRPTSSGQQVLCCSDTTSTCRGAPQGIRLFPHVPKYLGQDIPRLKEYFWTGRNNYSVRPIRTPVRLDWHYVSKGSPSAPSGTKQVEYPTRKERAVHYTLRTLAIIKPWKIVALEYSKMYKVDTEYAHTKTLRSSSKRKEEILIRKVII